MKYYNEKMETMDREEIVKLQSERLKDMLRRIKDVPFYKEKFAQMGIDVNEIRGVEDLPLLPFTIKNDLRDNYPFNLMAVPMKDIVELHASSGTTGKPIVVGLTKGDIDMWGEIVARCLVAAHATPESILQVSYGYGLFTGGFGLHYGGEKLGATVLPMSGGNTAKQLMLMDDFGSTHLACTPSYAMYLAETLQTTDKPEREKLKYGIFGAEPWSESMRREIESSLGIEAFDIYGLTEAIGPGVGIDCECHNGLHIWEDNFIVEIIDPVTLKPLGEGEVGEVVLTTITKEGMPILRYRTRDLSSITYEKCACGRTHARLNRVGARSDDMLIIRGVNVFPSQIEDVLLSCKGVSPNYQIVVSKKGTLDALEIQVELDENTSFDTISDLETLANDISSSVQSVLGVHSKIKLMEKGSLPRSEGKAKRVIDLRKEN